MALIECPVCKGVLKIPRSRLPLDHMYVCRECRRVSERERRLSNSFRNVIVW